MNALKLATVAALLLLSSSVVFGQQEYVGKYDVYAGYMYLNSSLIKLGESGFHTQVGMNPKRWYALGFDYSTGSGDTALVPSMLISSLQKEIAAQLAPYAPLLPAGYVLKVPLHSRSDTFAMGPQLSIRRLRWMTIFLRPDLGAIREEAVPHPGDMISKLLVAQLAPSGKKVDWTYFYGFAGGVDLNVTKNFSLRLQADYVRDHLFNDLLNSRNSVRLSVGPSFHFGPNVPSL
ncbi:MAG: hypothetical protein U0Q18_02645 [Bryobacteraceae bacterium]